MPSKFDVGHLSDHTKLPFYDKTFSCTQHPSAEISEASLDLIDFTCCGTCKKILTKSKRKPEMRGNRANVIIFDDLENTEFFQELT